MNMFRSTGSYEPDRRNVRGISVSTAFRSTGSYEPDPIHRNIWGCDWWFRSTGSYEPDHHTVTDVIGDNRFDPQALTSLTRGWNDEWPWLYCFDPQALTSLTNLRQQVKELKIVSIHRLLRAWPFKTVYLKVCDIVSIHRLLRAWPMKANICYIILRFRSTGSYEPDLLGKTVRPLDK